MTINTSPVGQPSNITSVVRAFLDNEPGFSRADVSSYVNQALRNASQELLERSAVAEDWKRQWGPNPSQDFADEYSQVRQGLTQDGLALADALVAAKKSKRVLIEADTALMIVAVDQRVPLGDRMQVDDVPRYFGVKPEAAQAQTSGISAQTASSGARAKVDFSRFVTPETEEQKLDREVARMKTLLPKLVANEKVRGGGLKQVGQVMDEIAATPALVRRHDAPRAQRFGHPEREHTTDGPEL